jgi:FAD/FMN-containing dehydrogenase
LTAALEWGLEQGLVADGALASSDTQRAHFWRLREEQPKGQRLEGEQLKHDICAPPGKIAQFLSTPRRPAKEFCLACASIPLDTSPMGTFSAIYLLQKGAPISTARPRSSVKRSLH